MKTSTADTAPRAGLPAVPAATRAQRPGWRDPRIWVGLAIVAACVLVGARVMAAADETVQVWAVAESLPAGSPVTAADLELRRVHFADEETRDQYLGQAELPDDARVARDLDAGELLPRSALSGEARTALVEMPLGVEPDDLPATVRRGSVVDVWVTPTNGAADGTATARRVLDDVVVVDLPRAADGFAPQGTRQVIVGVPVAAADGLGKAIGAVSSGRVVLTVAGK